MDETENLMDSESQLDREREDANDQPPLEETGDMSNCFGDDNDELHTSEQSEDSAEQCEAEDEKPIYEGSRITLAQSMLLLMMLYIKHGLTNEALTDILMVVELHCLAPNILKCTLHQFKRFFVKFKQHICFKYYCSYCYTYYGDKKDIPQHCDVCNKTANPSWFITVPVEEQVKALLLDDQNYKSIKKYRKSRQKKAGCISDVMDGQLYKSHFHEDGFFLNATPKNKCQEIHLSFQLNTDGVSVFHSSTFGLWPVYLLINELDPKLRMHRKNRIFAGLWFGARKPDFKTFLRPFAEELRSLYEPGFQFARGQETETIRCILLSASMDSPAKCLFMDMTQFNGYHGCPCCNSPGESLRTGGRGWCHVYPFNVNSDNGHGVARTHDQALANGREADHSGKRVNGFKGTTWFMFLPNFDFISGISIDYMHQLLLGVTRQIVGLWVKNSKEPFSLFKHLKEIDQRLLQIKPPNKITRVPRALAEHFSRYKAAEWRSFLLYYSLPCLYGILPDIYFQHFLLLVEASHILLGSSILIEDISKSKRLLKHFCCKMSDLYGKRHESFNVHLLLHLPGKVLDLGPLWTNSLFYFEDLNGDLKHLFKGTQKIELQIIQNICIQQQIPVLIKQVPEESAVYSLLKKLERGAKRFNVKEVICEGIKVVGASVRVTLTGRFLGALQRVVYLPEHVYKFKRLYFYGSVIHSQGYHCVKKRNSYTVSFDFNNGEHFGFVKFFLTVTPRCLNVNVCNHTCVCRQKKYFAMIEVLQQTSQFFRDSVTNTSLTSIFPVKRTTSLVCVPVSKLKEMCIFVECGGRCFICKFPNNVEKD